MLVIPIDKAAPKGRLILPQQQTIRDILDHGATAIAVRDLELSETLRTLGRTPDLVITDSQVFDAVAKIVPREVPLTSFSILFARYKGNLELAAHGAQTLKTLKDGDHVLICEGCTHHRQCEDIGTVKLPRMLKQFTQKDLQFTFTSGTDFPSDLSPLSGNHPLRRMHADRKRNAVSIRLRQRTGHSNYELWNCHCVYARDFREKYGVSFKKQGQSAPE